MVGFIYSDNLKSVEPIVENDFCHSMAIGETGCGKTSSFILPNIRKRIQSNHGLFVIDYKGTLHGQVKIIADEENSLHKVVEIGTSWGDSFDILKNVSKNLFLSMLDGLVDTTRDKFWHTSSINFITNVYDTLFLVNEVNALLSEADKEKYEKVLNSINKYPFKISSLVKIVQSRQSLEQFINFITDFSLLISDFYLLSIVNETNSFSVKKIKQNCVKIDNLKIILSNFEKEMDKSSPASGNGGVFFSARSLLLNYDLDGLNGEEDIIDMLNDGRIILLRCDTYSPAFITSLMNLIYTKLAQRYVVTANPITIFIDEFQRSVTVNTIPFVDVFREKKVELIGAIQNIEQLEIVLGQKETQAFLGNIIHQYVFEKSKKFIYTKDKKEYQSIPLFYDYKQIDDVQLKWQSFLDYKLKEDYVFHFSNNDSSFIIRNIHTNELKNYYILDKKNNSDFFDKVDNFIALNILEVEKNLFNNENKKETEKQKKEKEKMNSVLETTINKILEGFIKDVDFLEIVEDNFVDNVKKSFLSLNTKPLFKNISNKIEELVVEERKRISEDKNLSDKDKETYLNKLNDIKATFLKGTINTKLINILEEITANCLYNLDKDDIKQVKMNIETNFQPYAIIISGNNNLELKQNWKDIVVYYLEEKSEASDEKKLEIKQFIFDLFTKI